jgi:hypothetical protein
MTMWLAALAGFSIGMAGLLAVAMGTAYRDLPLSWTARLGGGVMLAGLAHTAWHHIGFAAWSMRRPHHLGVPAITRFYLLLRGLLQPAGLAHRLDGCCSLPCWVTA